MEATLKSQTETPRRFWWHWQNLNDKKGGTQGSGFRHGRCWWHFPKSTIELCWNLWTTFCGVRFDIDDEDATVMVAFPPFAFWVSVGSRSWLLRWWPRKPLSVNYPDTFVIDERECGVSIHSGKIWINVWSKKNEMASKDPWWVRGISFQLNPFEWRHQAHEVWRELDTTPSGGYWVPFVGSWEIGHPSALNKFQTKEPDLRTEYNYPYLYVLKNGTVQERVATVHIERWSRRPLCLRWTRIFERTRQSIAVSFNDEVGEKSGSWKGGCTGCSYDLLPGESAERCLRRMEMDRRF